MNKDDDDQPTIIEGSFSNVLDAVNAIIPKNNQFGIEGSEKYNTIFLSGETAPQTFWDVAEAASKRSGRIKISVEGITVSVHI